MHDPWIDRLSEYIDGDLDAATARELEQHLASCDVCSRTLAELRHVVAVAGGLVDEPPARDLWAGIAAGIAPGAGAITPLETRRTARRISLSLPQLAAAAVVLMAISAGAVWFAVQPAAGPETMSGTIVQTAGGATGDVRLVAAPARVYDPQYQETVTELERSLEQRRGQLDPATVEVLERSIETIDAAIAEARRALESDPGNPYLHRQLDNSMRKKLDVLERANGIRRAGT